MNAELNWDTVTTVPIYHFANYPIKYQVLSMMENARIGAMAQFLLTDFDHLPTSSFIPIPPSISFHFAFTSFSYAFELPAWYGSCGYRCETQNEIFEIRAQFKLYYLVRSFSLQTYTTGWVDLLSTQGSCGITAQKKIRAAAKQNGGKLFILYYTPKVYNH